MIDRVEKMLNFALKNDGLCSKNDEFSIKNDELGTPRTPWKRRMCT